MVIRKMGSVPTREYKKARFFFTRRVFVVGSNHGGAFRRNISLLTISSTVYPTVSTVSCNIAGLVSGD